MSFEEINKSTYQCKQCKASSRVLNILFEDQNPCVTLNGSTYCFRKKTRFPKIETLASNATVDPPIKTLRDKSEEANIEPVPRKAKMLPYME